MPSAERDRPPARHRVRRVRRVDPTDRPPPQADGPWDAERRQRLERPAEEERGGVGGSAGTGPWAADGRRPASRHAATAAAPAADASQTGPDVPSAASSHGPSRTAPSDRATRRTLRVSWPRPPSGGLPRPAAGAARCCDHAQPAEDLHGEFPQDRPLIRRDSPRSLVGAVLILGDRRRRCSSAAATRSGCRQRVVSTASSRRRPSPTGAPRSASCTRSSSSSPSSSSSSSRA